MNRQQYVHKKMAVEIKRPSEILATLDENGKLDGLPFMPEMAAYCGSRIEVYKSVRRTCVVDYGFRRMKEAVFLQDSRCDGSYHDHCDRACMLFWKKDWLKIPDASDEAPAAMSPADLDALEKLRALPTRSNERYVCQSTELKSATLPLHRWDPRPLFSEIVTRELSVKDFFKIIFLTLMRRIGVREKIVKGTVGKKSRGNLDLKAGEWVEVKPIEELEQNLDESGANCGLGFRPTMRGSIGKRYQVSFPVRRIIIEETGKMVELRNTAALKGAFCKGPCVSNCPRAEYLYYRESWLRRSEETS